MNKLALKVVNVEYGDDSFQINVPSWCDILKMRKVRPLENPLEEIEYALSNPVGSPSIEDIITYHKKPSSSIGVAIAVSDNTRPVPYNGEKEDGVLLPLLNRLKKAGISIENIKIIIATGTHTSTSNEWKKDAFGDYITDRYEIIDHSCTSSDLRYLADIDGVAVKINPQFADADIRIVTGLVEPHIMAGVSGGRKAVCPGLVNLEATYLFHGVEFIDNPHATNLILNDNPCHDFALKVARKAGVHFSINAVLNGEMKLAGVFAGDLEKSHLEAAKRVKGCALVKVGHEYDIVLTHGGKVAVNHYQAVKAAYGVMPIIKRGGIVILAAHNSDEESIGKDDYIKIMKVLKDQGPGKFTEFIKSDNWQFVPDQWEAQKWDQFFQRVGSFDSLIYCTTNISPKDLKGLPGRSGYDFVEGEDLSIEKMVQNAVSYAVEKKRQEVKKPAMAFVKEGPYAVPLVN